MKIDRRSFLAFAIGGAAGTALTPLPWKLTDDLSIWTQNWPWTPVPQRGEVAWVRSVCTLCPGACGITVRKVGGRAVKIEGSQDHPVSRGKICPLGLSGLQLLYGRPNRVKTPLKRVGERGAGQWQRISWEDAIGEASKALADIRAKNRPHAVGSILESGRGTVSRLFERFMAAYGSPNFIETASAFDTYGTALRRMQGSPAKAGFDFENAGLILSFGSGLLDGWGSPVHMFRTNAAWKKRGTRLVQIEPRLSNTAARSDRWVPVNPGTEAVLALGIAHVLVKEELYNREFIANSTSGFEGFQRLVLEAYGPDAVSGITGVGRQVIVSLARSFAKAKAPIAVCGRGAGRRNGGSLPEFMAVHALNALVGNIDRKGGTLRLPGTDYIDWPEPQRDGIAGEGAKKERVRLPAAVAAGKPYPIEALLVSGANPLYNLPGARAALEKVPFVVSFSSYMDETAGFSDLILPDHVFLERFEDSPTPPGFGFPVIGLSKPVVPPQFNTRHVGDALIQIAREIGGPVAEAFPWESYEACLEETLGDKWETLVETGFWADTGYSPAGPRGATASGKLAFPPELAAYKPLPAAGDAASYPLLLIPYDTTRLTGGYVGAPPFLVKSVDETVLRKNESLVEINPKTAAPLGLYEGSRAVLTTPFGRAGVLIHLFDGIMPGLIALPRGLGHTAFDRYLAEKGVNVDLLIGPAEDPASGTDAAWGVRASLKKV